MIPLEDKRWVSRHENMRPDLKKKIWLIFQFNRKLFEVDIWGVLETGGQLTHFLKSVYFLKRGSLATSFGIPPWFWKQFRQRFQISSDWGFRENLGALKISVRFSRLFHRAFFPDSISQKAFFSNPFQLLLWFHEGTKFSYFFLLDIHLNRTNRIIIKNSFET